MLQDDAYMTDKVYVLEAFTWNSPSYARFEERLSFREPADVVMDIIMSQDSEICGQICDRDGIPIPGAQVRAYSETFNQWKHTESGADSVYHFETLSDVSDWVITVTADGYPVQRKTGRSSGTSVNFYFEPVGVISGYARDAGGTGLESVVAEARSESSDFAKNTITGRHGHYLFEELPTYDSYTITVYAPGFMPRSENQRHAGDEVSFVFQRDEGRISGKITDSAGKTPPRNITVIIKLFDGERQECVGITGADGQGEFEISGLTPDISYLLRISAFGTSLMFPAQWRRKLIEIEIDPENNTFGYGLTRSADALPKR